MKDYLVRLGELALVAFVGAAVPVLVQGDFSKAALSGALSAGVAAVYGVLAKGSGDKDRPTVSK